MYASSEEQSPCSLQLRPNPMNPETITIYVALTKHDEARDILVSL